MSQQEYSAAALADLRSLLGEDLQATLMEYLEGASKLIHTAQGAALGQNPNGVRDCMHTLKSTSAVVGAVALANLAATLEHAVRSGLPVDLDAHLARVAGELVRVRAWLTSAPATAGV